MKLSSVKASAKVDVNEKGNFSLTLGIIKAGDRVSAIATHPQYSTSEPAVNALVRFVDGSVSQESNKLIPKIPLGASLFPESSVGTR